jgi:hypothetical protein
MLSIGIVATQSVRREGAGARVRGRVRERADDVGGVQPACGVQADGLHRHRWLMLE